MGCALKLHVEADDTEVESNYFEDMAHHLKDIESTDERCEPREGLFAAPSHTDKEGVSPRRLQYSVDAANVGHGVLKQYQVHGRVRLVVVLQRVLQDLVELKPGGHEVVVGIADTVGEVAQHQRPFQDDFFVLVLQHF